MFSNVLQVMWTYKRYFYRFSSEAVGGRRFITVIRWGSARSRWTRWKHLYAHTAGTWGGAAHHSEWFWHPELQHWPWCPQYQHWITCKFTLLPHFTLGKKVQNHKYSEDCGLENFEESFMYSCVLVCLFRILCCFASLLYTSVVIRNIHFKRSGTYNSS